MGEKTKIPWTDASWNPVLGCSKTSAGCANCYAERMAARFPERYGHSLKNGNWTGVVRMKTIDKIREPERWKRPRRIFVCSMSDLFHESLSDADINMVFKVIRNCPQHTFQVLTKRAARMLDFLRRYGAPLPNLWAGVTAENQATADLRIPRLLEVQAAVRFVSVEPMLGPVDLRPYLGHIHEDEIDGTNPDPQPDPWEGEGMPMSDPWIRGLDWVICGGESGPGARPIHPIWVRKLKNDCVKENVPFMLKQWGEWIHHKPEKNSLMDGAEVSEFRYGEKKVKFETAGDGGWFLRVGKKAAGRELDGKVWNEFPRV